MNMADSAYWAHPPYNRLTTLENVDWAKEARRVMPQIWMNTKNI